MSQRKIVIIKSRLERGSPGERAAGAGSSPQGWWSSMLSSLRAGRRGRYQATLKRLAQSDVADTVSEADVESWLKMLDAEAGERVPMTGGRQSRE